ncbi:MAG: hypothetical protein WC370_05710 [Dehalococcoidales bacterium]|jgi:hypothetical protein
METFRDVVLCIFGLGATAGIVILVVLAFLLYFRLKPVLDSINKTAKTIEHISTSVEDEVAKPIAQAVAFIQGIRQAVGLVGKLTRKEEK